MKINGHVVYIFVIVALVVTMWLGTRYAMGKITGYQNTIATLKAKNVSLKAERDDCKAHVQSLRNQSTLSYGTCTDAMQSLLVIPSLALPPVLTVEEALPPLATQTTSTSDDAAYTAFINAF